MMIIGMSLPKHLLKEFDEVVKEHRYQSRSKGIQDALKDYIVRYQWMNEMNGERVGILTVIYGHHYTDITEDLTNIQHDYRKYINAVIHVHISKKYCLDVIIVKGNVKSIRELTEKIMRLKGVEQRLTSARTGETTEVES
ncbi:MAG: nickel-responsive transcriptional regulator NikR [Euryarchaeota archaeon]|nr:nickel-responsive transcriptional regulator NikR [Euryarchaeota archaeon]